VFDSPGENISDRFDTSVRVPGKARQIVFWDVVSKVVEQEKGVEVRRVAKTKCPPQVHTRTFHRRLGADKPLNRPNRHSLTAFGKVRDDEPP
jgi:hypothetical protein